MAMITKAAKIGIVLSLLIPMYPAVAFMLPKCSPQEFINSKMTTVDPSAGTDGTRCNIALQHVNIANALNFVDHDVANKLAACDLDSLMDSVKRCTADTMEAALEPLRSNKQQLFSTVSCLQVLCCSQEDFRACLDEVIPKNCIGLEKPEQAHLVADFFNVAKHFYGHDGTTYSCTTEILAQCSCISWNTFALVILTSAALTFNILLVVVLFYKFICKPWIEKHSWLSVRQTEDNNDEVPLENIPA